MFYVIGNVSVSYACSHMPHRLYHLCVFCLSNNHLFLSFISLSSINNLLSMISIYIFLSYIQLSPVLLSFIFILSTNLSYIYHLNSHIFPLSFIQFISSLYNLFIFHLSICQLALFLFLFIPNVFYHSTVNLCSVYGVQIHFMRP